LPAKRTREIEEDVTSVIEVAVGEMPDPWPLLMPPRIRGVA
jgi:hypothetical protein